MPNISGWDHVVRSNADLPAPVAGVINLTSGSWAFAAPIALGANLLYVPAGADVYLQGMGTDKLITGNVSCLQVEGNASLRDLSLRANGGIALEAAANGRVRSSGCTLTGNSAFTTAVLSGTAEWRDVSAQVTNINGGAGIDVSGTAKAYLALTDITANGSAAILSGGALWGTAVNFKTDSVGAQCIHLNNAGSQLRLTDCDVSSLIAACPAIRINAGALLNMMGGSLHTLNAFKSEGICIDGAIPLINIEGVYNYWLSHGVRWISGAVSSAKVSSSHSSFSTLVGVDWAAANLPSKGLMLFSNLWDIAAPLSGFTAASARCTLRGCYSSGGAMAETAIV